MPTTQIKQRKRPDIGHPSGRGTGLPAAGVHAVDRKLGATPTDFRKQGYSGQPSTSADVGFSRAIQRVNRGFEAQKALEDVPEISWSKKNARSLSAMGLTPNVIVEMYLMLQRHQVQTPWERQIISEVNKRVLMSHRKIRTVTRIALEEGAIKKSHLLNEFMGVGDFIKSSGIEDLVAASGMGPKISRSSDEPIPPDLLGNKNMSGDPVDQQDLMKVVRSPDITAQVLACNSNSMEILQTFFAVTGVLGDLGTMAGIPIGMAADLVNACLNIACENYFYAFLDVIAVVPFVGDLSKIFYAKRLIKTLGIDDGMKLIASADNVADQAQEAAKIINTALDNNQIGARTSSAILALKRAFGSAESMAARMGSLLRRAIDTMIGFFEGIKTGAESGKLTAKAAQWMISKAPFDILDILKRIRDKGLNSFKEFVIKLFGRESLQMSASGAHAKEVMLPSDEPEEGSAEAYIPPEATPFTGRRSFDSLVSAFEKPQTSGYTPILRGDSLQEAKKKRKGKQKISLIKAMDGDDSVIDETSTTASIAGFALPLGMASPGPHKSLDKLVPGYEFAQGRYPYSR